MEYTWDFIFQVLAHIGDTWFSRLVENTLGTELDQEIVVFAEIDVNIIDYCEFIHIFIIFYLFWYFSGFSIHILWFVYNCDVVTGHIQILQIEGEDVAE